MKIRIETRLQLDEEKVHYGIHPDVYEFPMELNVPKKVPTMSREEIDRIADMARAYVALILEQFEACHIDRQLKNMTRGQEQKMNKTYTSSSGLRAIEPGTIYKANVDPF